MVNHNVRGAGIALVSTFVFIFFIGVLSRFMSRSSEYDRPPVFFDDTYLKETFAYVSRI